MKTSGQNRPGKARLPINTRFPVVLVSILLLGILLDACGDSPTNQSLNNITITTAPANSAPTFTAVQQSGTTALNTPTPSLAAQTGVAKASPTAGQGRLTQQAAVIRRADGQQIKMTVELARTSQEQETGLMGRTSLPPDSGMLFIFQSTGRVSFWMKDTPLPLSIAFIAADGKIVDIQDMQPYSEAIITPRADHQYALEVTQGYFAEKGVKVGDVFSLVK